MSAPASSGPWGRWEALRRPHMTVGADRTLIWAVEALLASEPEDIPGAADEAHKAITEYVKAMGQEEL